MLIWQRNHAGGSITARVVQVADTVYHVDAVDPRERVATLHDRLRSSLELAQARADEMARDLLRHECQAHLCDEWHIAVSHDSHGQPYPLRPPDAPRRDTVDNLLIIRRGRAAWADFLLGRLGSLTDHVEFRWDRRFGERRRRAGSTDRDRRGRDRRGPAPAAWNSLNFILVYSLDPRR